MLSQQPVLHGVDTLQDFVRLLGPRDRVNSSEGVESNGHGHYHRGSVGPTISSDAGPSKMPRGVTGIGHKGSRARTGCLTCRLRKKRCDEAKPECETCSRLGIQCLGYGFNRPDWLKDKNNLKQMRHEIREKVLAQRTARPRRRGSSEHSDTAGSEREGRRSRSQLAQSEDPADGFTEDPSTQRYNETQSFASTNGHLWQLGNGTSSTDSQSSPHLSPLSTLLGPLPASMIATSPMGHYDNTAMFNDPEMEETWKTIFGNTGSGPQFPFPVPAAFAASPTVLSPSTVPDLPENSFLTSPSSSPLIGYIHHYLINIMPLQFRTARSMSVGDVVGPLAFQSTEILTSVSSLAALHLAQKRVGLLPSNGEDALSEFGDCSTLAVSAHQDSLDRLKYVTKENLAAEEVIVPALFAVSYHLFKGGTSPRWREPMALCQKCIAAALSASPELTKEYTGSADSPPGTHTPWQRYRPLIEVMISTDIIAGLSSNRATPSLPMYRVVLGRISGSVPPEQSIDMLTVMGCDNVTLLGIAETTALSEWREREEAAGTLSHRILLQKAERIEQQLGERAWRMPYIDLDVIDQEAQGPPDEWTKTYLMSCVYFAALKLLIATIVNGPFPRVPEIADAVQETVDALKRIASRYERPDILRKLVFPITISGCHCTTEDQRQFFRESFTNLGPEAAFGNTGSARTLMEEVWRRRERCDPGAKICWRQVMRDLGWDAGLLMI